ncbi:flagellar basal body-associated FliL family protein [Elioraea rosea]|uniref:flagellar basal body-associated FliL family protein n=1 Tax=Elioraea rosea TaxID=2492390 RepID=UPI001185B1F6|nr:flagellar basal body-associated FliL family protein [Elioraea rosea]
MSGGAAAAVEPGAEGAEGAKKGGRKKLILLAVPLLLIGAGAGLWFSGILPGMLGMGAKPAEEAVSEPPAIVPALFDMPEIIVNLNVGNRRASYLKLRSKIEIADSRDVAHVQAAVPRLQDLFTTYLRELRPEELRGSAGTHRLREELIARANVAARPARVTDVLFVEMLVQ